MPFRNVLDADDLAVLRETFDDHCARFGITSKEGRASVAASLMVHYQNGVSNPTELRRLLDAEERFATGPAMRADPLI
ncbi:MAG: hypothetical protein KF874_06190 [Rhizobiaceae bacterium]|nr:hypothetical protein [Rhizobiaceae bacterium]